MGSLLRRSRSRESTCSLTEPASGRHNTASAFTPVSVHTPSTATPCPTHLRTCFSHKPFALHSPFCASCGSRGKQGPLNTSTHPVFQFPSIPQPRFRKLTRKPTLSLPAISATFPLLLPERRVLLSYFFISYTFSSSPSRCTRSPADLSIILRRTLPHPNRSTPEQPIPGIQRSTPLFHVQNYAKVNTIKMKKRELFPSGGYLLYSVASAEYALIGFFGSRKTRVSSWRTWKMKKLRSWPHQEQRWRLL